MVDCYISVEVEKQCLNKVLQSGIIHCLSKTGLTLNYFILFSVRHYNQGNMYNHSVVTGRYMIGQNTFVVVTKTSLNKPIHTVYFVVGASLTTWTKKLVATNNSMMVKDCVVETR